MRKQLLNSKLQIRGSARRTRPIPKRGLARAARKTEKASAAAPANRAAPAIAASRRVSLGMDGRLARTLSARRRPTIHLTKIASAHAAVRPTCRTGAMNPSSSRSRSRHMFEKFGAPGGGRPATVRWLRRRSQHPLFPDCSAIRPMGSASGGISCWSAKPAAVQ